MNPHFQRAQALLGMSRWEAAEQELRRLLLDEPNHAAGHAYLAICLAQRQVFDEATAEAQQAIHLEPDDSLGYYALSTALVERNRWTESETAIVEAIRLDPYDARYFSRLARIQLAQRRWQPALDAAEQGLQVDAEHSGCANLRAMALVQLGRKDLAGAAVDAALRRNPEDAVTHANQGWILIERGEHAPAMDHFREALRLEPEMEWAREGIVEALKSRYFLYRIMLSYFLWMAKLSHRAQWGILIGGFVGFRVLRTLAQGVPSLAPFIVPVLILYVAFVVLTWIANPVFNLLLRLNRFGRLALSGEQIIASNWVGLCLASAIAFLVMYFAAGIEPALGAAVVCGLVVPPLAAIYACDEGWPRTTMISITAGVASLGVLAVAPDFLSPVLPEPLARVARGLALPCLLGFVFSAVGSQFAANALIAAEVRR